MKLKIAEAISIHYCAYMSDHFTNILQLKESSPLMQHYQDHTVQDKIVLILKKQRTYFQELIRCLELF